MFLYIHIFVCFKYIYRERQREQEKINYNGSPFSPTMTIHQWKFQESISCLVQLFCCLSQLVFSISQNPKEALMNRLTSKQAAGKERGREGGRKREREIVSFFCVFI